MAASNVVRFRARGVRRVHALNWLKVRNEPYPQLSKEKWHTCPMLGNWRFVFGSDGIVYFANGIEPGICKAEVEGIQ